MKESQKTEKAARQGFTEAGAWESIGTGWRPLHGSFRELGYSIEWHDFEADGDVDWSGSFHPEGVEICLNVAGRGEVRAGSRQLRLAPKTAGFYLQGATRLTGVRHGGERHQFITIEYSRGFLARHVALGDDSLHPGLRPFLGKQQRAAVSEATPLSSKHQELVGALQNPPGSTAAQRLWSHAKALEVAASVFYTVPAADGEFFCERVRRINHDRVQAVIAILNENLSDTLSLEEIGRRAGCSQFHLSRIFSEQMGCGIFQYLRRLRLERAAEMLLEDKRKITQIALEVGYSSPSHFSTAFHEMFGCCPGLYPLKTAVQKKIGQQAPDKL